MNVKEATREAVRQVCVKLYPDAEMQEAIDEYNKAHEMLDNASNKWRIDEAVYRMKAANRRFQAIRYERGEEVVDVK